MGSPKKQSQTKPIAGLLPEARSTKPEILNRLAASAPFTEVRFDGPAVKWAIALKVMLEKGATLCYNRCCLSSAIINKKEWVGWSPPLALLSKVGAGRKVRAGKGTVVANGHRGQPQGKCHRKYTADDPNFRGTGNGEMVR